MRKAERLAKWERLVRDQAASGQSGRAFCRERGVSVAQFYQWRRRFGAGTVGQAAGFVEVVTRGGGSGVSLRLNGDGSAEFVLARDFDEGTLRRAFAAVSGQGS